MTQPGALKNVYDFNPGTAARSSRTSCGSSRTARWTEAENYVPNNYPNLNFVPGQTSPTLLNTTTLTYAPPRAQELANDARRRRRLLGADGAPHVADERRRTRSASTTTTRSGRTLNATATTSQEALNSDVLLPVLRPPGAVVGAADQPAAARGRVLAPPGNLGQASAPMRHRRSAGRRHHRQQPADAGARLRAVDPELPRARGRHRHGEPQPELPRQLQPCRT